MLCTTPESLCERLPISDATEDLVVIADVRIDERSYIDAVVAMGGFESHSIAPTRCKEQKGARR